MSDDTLAGRRRRIVSWSLAAALFLVPAIMLGLIYALGPVGTCEADLNDSAIFLVWIVSIVVGGLIAYALFLVGGRRVVPRGRWRHALAPAVALGVSAAIFLLGLIPILTNTTCAE